jgi:hypothetical protein
MCSSWGGPFAELGGPFAELGGRCKERWGATPTCVPRGEDELERTGPERDERLEYVMNDALAEDGVELHERAPQTPFKPLRIYTTVSFAAVKRTEVTPESDAAFAATPFECPLCLRFCSAILRSTCCQYNLCHDCAVELRPRANTSCPHCRARPLVLEDQPAEELIQCYRDSPKVASKIRKMNIQLYSKRLTANEEGDGHNSLLLRC